MPVLPIPFPVTSLSDPLAPRFISPSLSLSLSFLSSLLISMLLSFPQSLSLSFPLKTSAGWVFFHYMLFRLSQVALRKWAGAGVRGVWLGPVGFSPLCSIPWGPGSVWAKLPRQGGSSYPWESPYQSSLQKQDRSLSWSGYFCYPWVQRKFMRLSPCVEILNWKKKKIWPVRVELLCVLQCLALWVIRKYELMVSRIACGEMFGLPVVWIWLIEFWCRFANTSFFFFCIARHLAFLSLSFCICAMEMMIVPTLWDCCEGCVHACKALRTEPGQIGCRKASVFIVVAATEPWCSHL